MRKSKEHFRHEWKYLINRAEKQLTDLRLRESAMGRISTGREAGTPSTHCTSVSSVMRQASASPRF